MSRSKRLLSTLASAWHSVILWMPWSRSRMRRELLIKTIRDQLLATMREVAAEQWQTRQTLARLLESQSQDHLKQQRQLMVEAMTPLAEAMQRQDQRQQEQTELLLELLQTRHQPPIFPGSQDN